MRQTELLQETLPRPSADVERVRNIAANVLWLHSERVRNSINCCLWVKGRARDHYNVPH
jgi:hypothetical protein